MRWKLAALFIVFFAGTVLASTKLTTNYQGVIYQYTLPLTAEVENISWSIGPRPNLFVAFNISGEAFCVYSVDNGKTFSAPLKITGEAAAYPSVAADGFGKPHLVYTAEDEKLKLSRLYYAPLTNIQSLETTFESKVIFESQDQIINPKLSFSQWGVVIRWQEQYLDRTENYVIASPNRGKHFGAVKNDLPQVPPPSTPKFLAITKTGTPEVRYLNTGNETVMCKVELSANKYFRPENIWIFEQLSFAGSPEANYPLPVQLADGRYFIRLSAYDGLSASPFSDPLEFKIDNTPPAIAVSTLDNITAEAWISEEKEITLKGKISEAALLSLNGFPVTAEANEFKITLNLAPGKNTLIFIATDEAGNTGALQRTILYSSLLPEIRILKPKETDWFKPNSSIFIKAAVKAAQADIEDESEGAVIISGATMESRLIYDKKSGELSGFIDLPSNLPDGQLTAQVELRDSARNVGKARFILNIDSLAPVINHSLGMPLFTNSTNSVSIPVADAGAGVDASSTLLKLSGISLESAVSVEASNLTFNAKQPLFDGTYAVEITPRDRVGNTGKASVFSLIIDTAPPKLVVYASAETQTSDSKIIITGEAEDIYLSDVKINNNKKWFDIFTPAEKTFNRAVPLFPGNNAIEITALDKAGNQASHNLQVFSAIQASGALVTSYGNGPNPFSRQSDGQMFITYAFPGTANLKIYIFDLAGTLIWQKEIADAASGNTAWNGIDQFGNAVDNGVYLYMLKASSGGAAETKKGKIIVLN